VAVVVDSFTVGTQSDMWRYERADKFSSYREFFAGFCIKYNKTKYDEDKGQVGLLVFIALLT